MTERINITNYDLYDELTKDKPDWDRVWRLLSYADIKAKKTELDNWKAIPIQERLERRRGYIHSRLSEK